MKAFRKLTIGAALLLLCNSLLAEAASEPRHALNIPALPMSEALNELAAQTGIQIVFNVEDTKPAHITSPSIVGEFTTLEALDRLLAETGLKYELINARTVRVAPISISALTDPQNAGIRLAQGPGSAASTSAQGSEENRPAASPAENTEGSKLEEIVVTAQMRAQNLKDVPISIAAFSRDQLESRGIQNIEDLAMAVPELTVWQIVPGENIVSMRGMGNFTGSGPMVGMYLDGIAVPTQLDLRSNDLERIEVLNGPQGTLYGQASMGGTIKLMTHAPDLDHFGGSVSASSYNTRNSSALSARLNGVVNLPVVENVFGVRLAADVESIGGWADFPATGNTDVNDDNVSNIQLKARWRPTEALEIKGTVIAHDYNGHGAGGNNTDKHRNLKVYVVPTMLPEHWIKYDLYALEATYDFGSFSLQSSTGYVDMGTLRPEIGEYVTGGALVGFFAHYLNKTRTFTQELRLASAGQGPFTWVAGVLYRDDDGDFGGTIDLDIDGTVLLNAPVNIKRNAQSLSAYGNVSYALTDRLELGVGVRQFNEDQEHITNRAKDSFSSFDWRLYASFALTDDIRVYSSAATGFRSGGTNPAGLPSFDPDTVTSYELGSKMALLDGHFSAELALFYSDYKKIQGRKLDVTAQGLTLFNSNIGDAEIKGFDWSLNWMPTSRWTLSLGGDVVDTKTVKVVSAVGAKFLGDPNDFTPKNSLSVSVNYQFDWAANLPGYARVDYNRQGEMFYIDRFANLYGHSDVIGILNASLGIQKNGWTFELFGRNLLDETGDMGPQDGAFGKPIRTRPLSVGVKVSSNF